MLPAVYHYSDQLHAIKSHPWLDGKERRADPLRR